MPLVNLSKIKIVLILIGCCQSLLAQNESIVSNANYIRLSPNVNLGLSSGDTYTSYGMNVLLQAGGNKFWGVTFSQFYRLKAENHFFAAGIILEQKQFNWLTMSIGTIGYFNFDEEGGNYTGLVSGLGWEPNTEKRYSPFVTYRSDFIFSKKIVSISSITFGINIKILNKK